MLQVWTYIQERLAAEEGATMVEYAIIVAVIAVVVVAGASLLGLNVNALFNDVANSTPLAT